MLKKSASGASPLKGPTYQRTRLFARCGLVDGLLSIRELFW
jgi:hypothetical protein